jgi:hypothetical protein
MYVPLGWGRRHKRQCLHCNTVNSCFFGKNFRAARRAEQRSARASDVENKKEDETSHCYPKKDSPALTGATQSFSKKGK